jgi:hypothetical protein
MKRWTTYVELRYEQRRIDHVPSSPLREAIPGRCAASTGCACCIDCRFIIGSSTGGGPIGKETVLGREIQQVQSPDYDSEHVRFLIQAPFPY